MEMGKLPCGGLWNGIRCCCCCVVDHDDHCDGYSAASAPHCDMKPKLEDEKKLEKFMGISKRNAT